jgi:peroxin-4
MSARSATKRLVKELEAWNAEKARGEEKGVERLGPVNEGELLEWEAVINGVGVGGGYDRMRTHILPHHSPSCQKHPPR